MAGGGGARGKQWWPRGTERLELEAPGLLLKLILTGKFGEAGAETGHWLKEPQASSQNCRPFPRPAHHPSPSQKSRHLVLWSIRRCPGPGPWTQRTERVRPGKSFLGAAWGEETEAWTSAVLLEQRSDGNVEKVTFDTAWHRCVCDINICTFGVWKCHDQKLKTSVVSWGKVQVEETIGIKMLWPFHDVTLLVTLVKERVAESKDTSGYKCH